MKKNAVLLLIVLFHYLEIYGQGFSESKTYPSPDVAAISTFGLIPSSPFNGKSSVSIPLYNIKYKDLEVPMNIMYSTGGNRTEDHPGYMGLGWNLQAGGVIYRKVNHVSDEHIKVEPNGTEYTNEIGYYYTCGKIADHFSDNTFIENYALYSNVGDFAFDGEPDEFVFNFNGYSGTFYITRPYDNGPVEIKIKPNGNYRLRAEILEIKDHIIFNDYINTSTSQFQTRMTDRNIYSIKITDDAGNKYYFGNDPNAIEFSFNVNPSSHDFPNPGVNLSNPSNSYMGKNTIASAWHLTKIESPNGYSIELNYSKKGRVYTPQYQWRSYYYRATTHFTEDDWIGAPGDFDAVSGSGLNFNVEIQNPSYLDNIVTPLQTVNFSFLNSSQLAYSFTSTTLALFEDPEFSPGASTSYWEKLDAITITGLKQISFTYTDESTKRLKLDEVSIHGIGGSGLLLKQVYDFQYNLLMLPSYNSRMSDHWGFYNGIAYDYNSNYLTTREPNKDYLEAEMLTKIIYPTGGYLALEYEPLYYGKIAKQFPFTIENEVGMHYAGGLRISKLSSAANVGDIPLDKEYFYVKDYLTNGTTSSGVLSIEPQYENIGSARSTYQLGNWLGPEWGTAEYYYDVAVDNNILIRGSTNGNHVTYSEVTEKTGNGYTVYKYQNYDNGFPDEIPFTIYSNYTSKWQEEAFTSREDFRGLLTDEDIYDINKHLVKSIQYQYSMDESTPAYQVPYFYRYVEKALPTTISRVSTNKYFIKPPLLIKTVETDYAGGTILTSETDSKYISDIYPAISTNDDNFKIVESSTTSSKGDIIKSSYKYPINFSGTTVYDAMISRNIISPVIEQTENKNTTQLTLTKNNFLLFNTEQLALPSSVERSVLLNPLETRVQNNIYAVDGTLLEQQVVNDMKESFIWDYQNAFPIADIKNSAASDCAATSFEADGKGNFTFSGVPVTLAGAPTGTKVYPLSSATVITKTIDPGKTYNVTLWAANNSITVNGLSPVKTGRSFGSFTCYEYEISNAATLTISGTGNIDELRLYPKAALMSTSTYSPLIGMTSQTDANNRIMYYEYDRLGRLATIKDQDGNILKQYEYKYQLGL